MKARSIHTKRICRRDFLKLLSCAGLLAGCRCVLPAITTATDSEATLALVGGTLIDGTGAEPLTDATVLVQDERIMAMGFGMQYRAKFIDRTSIVDDNGTVLSMIDGNPGVAVATVAIKPRDATKGINALGGRWFLPVSQVTQLTSEFTQKIGMIWYTVTQKRRRMAL